MKPSPPPVVRRLALLLAAGALLLVVGYAAGRLGSAPEVAAPLAEAPPAGRPAVDGEAGLVPGPRHLGPSGGRTSALAARAAPADVAAAPEVATRVATDVRALLASRHADLLARCWPAEGLPGGARETTVTFALTFDARGREIARGIGEDRRAPAGALARCLRAMPGGALAVAPPGASVFVRVPVAFP